MIKQSQRIAPRAAPLASLADADVADVADAESGPADVDDRPPAHRGEDV